MAWPISPRVLVSVIRERIEYFKGVLCERHLRYWFGIDPEAFANRYQMWRSIEANLSRKTSSFAMCLEKAICEHTCGALSLCPSHMDSVETIEVGILGL
jgi:hypothetical protein